MLRWSWPSALFVLFSLHVSAQPQRTQVEVCAKLKAAGKSDAELSTCGTKWAIKNAENVVEFWEVHEVEFYWDSACTVELYWFETFESSVMSTMMENRGHRAFDKILDTRWSANCRFLMGGCGTLSQHVGIDTTGANPLALDAASPYANVRCTKIYQSFNQSRQTKSIAVVTWENETEESYHIVATYRDFTGGAWQKRPAAEHGMWRIWNSAPTAHPWEVAEFLFYTDSFCTQPVTGVVISSRPFFPVGTGACIQRENCDAFNPTFARDGVMRDGATNPDPLPTRWKAGCDFYHGCSANEAWIGLDFGQYPVTIHCIRVFQPTHEGFPEWGYPTYSPSLLLQSWNGYRWDNAGEVDGLTHGVWNDTLPAERSAWSITNYDRMAGSWIVYELGFYMNANCGTSDAFEHQVLGHGIHSNPDMRFDEQVLECRKSEGSCADLAVDAIDSTAWRASCSPCEQFDAWVGLMLRGKGRDVKCLRLLQSNEKEHMSAAVQLSFWDGTRWKRHRLEVGVGGGTWNVRPAAPRTMWRFYGASPTAKPWTLIGFLLYTDNNCINELQATIMSSGSSSGHPASHAFDDNNETYWEASCQPPKTGMQGCAQGSAWIGVQSTSAEISVGCFRLFQHEHRDRQVTSGRVQEWDGIGWKMALQYPNFEELGGGAWQMLPGLRGSMWRLTTHPTPEMVGFGVTELEFYRSSDCHGGLLEAWMPNVMPICSGYSSAKQVAAATGYTAHMLEIGDFSGNQADLAFDKSIATFWADITSSQSWIGLDFTTQRVDVRCAKLAMAGVHSLQTPQAEVQAWDGTQWATYAVAASPWKRVLFQPVPTTGGVGFQRRPMPSHTMWRLQNHHQMVGWDVMEVEFYAEMDCSGEVVRGKAIGSIPKAQTMFMSREHLIPPLAFDNDINTRWSADCPQGCSPGRAWIGLDIGSLVNVKCFRIYQTGQRETKASSVALAVWDGDKWDVTAQYGGLGGDTWHSRPAAPDSMWRVTYMKPAELCPDHGRGLHTRSWGVSELKFYADDDCIQELPGLEDGAVAIASGTRQRNAKVRSTKSSFDPRNVFDDDQKSFWAAQCGNQLGTDEAYCSAGLEWIGLDFSRLEGGGARDVRCFKIHQNRASGRECCDPAEEVVLERWNGKEWTIMSWRHQPITKPLVNIDGVFSGLGVCDSSNVMGEQLELQSRTSDLTEERKRRQSEQCIIPLAASVRLLSDPLCDKHPACAEAGYTGMCCPMDASLGLSRCCCNFLMSGQVFEDEFDKDEDREALEMYPNLGLELAVIRSVFVLPILGVAVALIMYILANAPATRRCCCYRPYMAICYPFQSWLKSESHYARRVAWFVSRGKGQNAWVMRIKFIAWLAVGFVGGGGIFWLMISYVISEFFIKITVLMSLVITFVRSPYKPRDPIDEQRMILMLRKAVTKARTLNFGSLGDVAAKFAVACVVFVVYSARGVFDFVLMRFSLMAVGMTDEKISVAQILYNFPELPIDSKPGLKLIYDGVGLSGQSFQEAFRWLFMGVPRCEGPVVLFSGMWLIAVTLLLIRWLNYDFFGIFVASKQVVTLTRPIFQKSIGLGFVQSFQGGLFLFMQCIMLLFTRALKLVNPLEEANQQWNCPYDGDIMSTIVGRTFLIGAAFVALVVTFLCANGHFMGQDYIVGEFSQWIGMDLSGLDPDGTGVDGSMIRFDTFLAMIPTTFGVWMDRWNVRGYLIYERADVYADQLDLPFTCQVCGEAHVPYHDVMAATGRQLSLAWQLIPAGALVGKACEYLNNPPLLYCGSALRCYHEHKHMKHTLEGIPKKLTSNQSIVVWGTLSVAFLKDKLFPFLLRLSCAATYGVLVYYSIMIKEQNMDSMSRECFTILLILSAVRAAAEYFLPALVLVLWGSILKWLPGERSVKPIPGDKGAAARKVPLAGQVINGVLSGSAVTLHFLMQDPWKFGEKFAIFFGVATGIVAGTLALFMGLMLEKFPSSPLSGGGALSAYLMAVAGCITWLISTGMVIPIRVVIGVSLAIPLVVTSLVTFRPPKASRGRISSPSRIAPLLVPPRFIPGLVGICAGVFGSGLAREGLYSWLGQYGGLATTLLWGLAVGTLLSFVIDSLIDTKAGHYAVPAGSIVAFPVALLWHWLPGVIAGAVVACFVGALVESSVHRAVSQETIAVAPRESKVQEYDDVTEEQASSLPTLCTATPRSDIASLKALPMAEETSRSLVSADLQSPSATKSDLGFTSGRDDQSPSPRQIWVRPGRAPPKKHSLAARAFNNSPWATGHSWSSPGQSPNARHRADARSPAGRPIANPGDESSLAVIGSSVDSAAEGVPISPAPRPVYTSPDRSARSNTMRGGSGHTSPTTRSTENYQRQASVVRALSGNSPHRLQRQA